MSVLVSFFWFSICRVPWFSEVMWLYYSLSPSFIPCLILVGWRDQNERFPSLAKWWEVGKSCIKGLSINYCCAKSSDNAVKRDLLSRLASHLKERVDGGVLSIVGPYQSVLQQLAAIDVEVAKGAQVRAQARWIEEGETSTSYFFHLEKKRASDRWIAAVRSADGQIVASPEGLCLLFVSLYC